MKIFWGINLSGNKAKNIYKLYKWKYNIPKTIIIENSVFDSIDDINFFNVDIYIVRPSYANEDGEIYSNAWKYTSLIFDNIQSIKDFIINNKDPNAYIIQEFIDCEAYWVYFTKNPSCNLLEGSYEFNNKHEAITSWKEKQNYNIWYFLKKELWYLWQKVNKLFNNFQEIECGIQNNKIIIFQSRNITTGNNTIYSHWELLKISWEYQLLDFDELGNNHDIFSYKIIQNILPIIYLNRQIYVKKSLLNIFFVLKFFLKKQENNYLFYKKYKKYLIKKILFIFIKIFSFQKLQKENIIKFHTQNQFFFPLNKQSKINKSIKFNNMNYITQAYISMQNIKLEAFEVLEKIKKNTDIKIYDIETKPEFQIKLQNKLLFYKWILINHSKHKKDLYTYIYKGNISWILHTIEQIEDSKNQDIILFSENMDINIYPYLEKIKWIIIKNWNLFSHNSIIIREYKIPCIIQYQDFNRLKKTDAIKINL